MLILGRREGDSILIEGGIRIVVVSCERGGVRIGIEAPSNVKILRGEIADKVALENQRATSVPVSSPWLTGLMAPAAPIAVHTATPGDATPAAEPTA
jgi:carbon storage regulator